MPKTFVDIETPKAPSTDDFFTSKEERRQPIQAAPIQDDVIIMERRKKRVDFVTTEGRYKRLRERCASEGVSMSEFINRAIERALEA